MTGWRELRKENLKRNPKENAQTGNAEEKLWKTLIKFTEKFKKKEENVSWHEDTQVEETEQTTT